MTLSKALLKSTLEMAGATMLEAKGLDKSVSAKEGPANFVTRYDVAIQDFLRKSLLRQHPNARFIGEEGDCGDNCLDGEVFIVDPIDGTTNFIHDLNASAISVARLVGGKVVEAAVYDPYRREFFYAEKGKGCTLNGQPVHVSEAPLSESLVCFGTSPYYPEKAEATFRLAQALLGCAVDLRRSGSAVIDLCQVVRGSAGLMFELQLSPWDYAACSLLVTEAGGRISQLDGSPLAFDRKCSVLAGGPAAYREFFSRGLNEGL